MNNLKNKKNISLIFLTIVIVLFVFVVYFVNSKIIVYKNNILSDYTKLAELENDKKIFDNYNRILIKGSDEYIKVKKHILSNDRREVLSLINQFEEYAKKTDLIENNNSPIVSVATRENSNIKKYNANDLVINIRVSGNEKRVDDFINLLNTLPMISYIEKIDMRFDSANKKKIANITLIVYQKNEIK